MVPRPTPRASTGNLTWDVNRDAWCAQGGLSRTEAKRRYISTLINTMHEYASQTPEARELVVELEFVWDQIKSNPPSPSSSSPLQSVGVPPLPQQSFPSISGRLARNEYVDSIMARNGMGDSRLRVLSPVSQPDARYRSRGSEMDDEGNEDDDGEVYAEAQDDLYDDDDDDSTRPEKSISDNEDEVSADASRQSNRRAARDRRKPQDSSKWRRRVEQALTKMTAEIAAVREQMEVRAVARRRRSRLWGWLKWIVWVALRQIIWDLAILGMLLIYMRFRGDRRVEDKLKVGWSEVKTRLAKLRSLRRTPRTPLLP